MPHRRFAVLVIVTAASVAGCGSSADSSSADSSGAQTSEPAQAPSGPDARTVAYSCADGSNRTISVEVPNSEQLADLINAINVCEFDGGLVDISVKIPCAQGDRTISVAAADNKLSNQAVIDACALGS